MNDINDLTNVSQQPDNTDDNRPVIEPFVARMAIYERIEQQVRQPLHHNLLSILGWQGTGRTTLLQHVNAHFDETIIGVYMAFDSETLADERTLLLALMQQTTQMLATLDYSLSRIPDIPETATDDMPLNTLRLWLQDDYLPVIYKIIRPYRHIVWLFDDGDLWLSAAQKTQLTPETQQFLYDLLASSNQLSGVITFDLAHEAGLDTLAPLVSTDNIIRLRFMTHDEATQLLKRYVGGLSAADYTTLYRATGGVPVWVQRLGQLIRQTQVVPEAITGLYNTSQAEIAAWWQQLSQNEQTLLTAIIGLQYDDPLARRSAERLQQWLIETDTLLDTTAIHATIRSLEYRELLFQSEQGYTLSADIMRRWLLENTQTPTSSSMPEATANSPHWLLWTLALLILLVIIMIALNQPAMPADNPIAPVATATLKQ